MLDYLNSVDTEYDRLWQSPPAHILANNLYKVLYNHGAYRHGAIAKLEELLVQSRRDAPTMLSGLNQTLSDRIAAADELAFDWVQADIKTDSQSDIWVPQDPTPIISDAGVASVDAIGLQIYWARQESPIRPGEHLRDSFRHHLDQIQNHFEELFGLGSHAFFETNEHIFSDLFTNNERLSRLIQSAKFRMRLVTFADAYSDAAAQLIKLSQDRQLRTTETAKLRDVAEAYLMSYSIDLMKLGVNFSSAEARNHAPILNQIRAANRELHRSIVEPASISAELLRLLED